jgi:GTP-binding protein
LGELVTVKLIFSDRRKNGCGCHKNLDVVRLCPVVTRGIFVKSAVLPQDYPEAWPEVALLGRSNSGKSTFLNALCGEAIAKVSASPGKTRLLNFFNIGEHYRVVDFPGYGYAARSKTERRLWHKMVEQYLHSRECLVGVLLLCDVRRRWTADEQVLVDWARRRQLGFWVVLTKIDKVNRAQSQRLMDEWLKGSKLPRSAFWAVCAQKNDGVQELEKQVFKQWIKPG